MPWRWPKLVAECDRSPATRQADGARECAASEKLEGGSAACTARPLCVSSLTSGTRLAARGTNPSSSIAMVKLIVGLAELYRIMRGIGAARTRETYVAVLRPWFGFLTEHGYQWNARPEAVREYARLFLIEAGCALRAGRVNGWFIQATNRSPSSRWEHVLSAAQGRAIFAVPDANNSC
jgi:hypothetical protein